ncbi:MAG: hypothetical protein AABX11_00670 [Nanoarchaeota archaeon]
MKIELKIGREKKKIEVHKVSFLGKISGLMFRTHKTRNLLFSFNSDGKRALHSWFVFFPFLVLWTDKNYNVQEFRMVKPFSTIVLPKKSFRNVIELPLNNKNEMLIRFIRGKI